MGTMTRKNGRSGKLLALIMVLSFPAGCQSGSIGTRAIEETRRPTGRNSPKLRTSSSFAWSARREVLEYAGSRESPVQGILRPRFSPDLGENLGDYKEF